MAMIYASWDELHTRRVRAIILSASIITMGLGIIWGTGFMLAGRPVLSALHVVMAMCSVPLLWLTLRGRLRRAAIIDAHLMPITVGIFCLFDKVPPELPRTTHLYFLSCAVGCYFVFRQQGTYLKIFIPLACLVAFALFGNLHFEIRDESLVIPQTIAWIGVWVNTIAALGTLVLIVVIINADLTIRRMMEVEMRTAIAKGGFSLHYQPQVNEAGDVVGAEALLRWPHAKLGNIPPGEIIPLAEETGLIIPIGNWVLREACAQLAAWEARPDMQHLTVSVNVSASQFRQPDFVHNVREIVRVSGINPSRLKLELTESMFVENIEATAAKMKALTEIGIIWSLDDFGTGYSSLSVLHRFPLGQIKIDRSFVRDMLSSRSNMVIIEAIIGLAKRLSLQVIAEGIETTEQLDRLRAAGCPGYQGYLFSRPLEIGAFESFLRSESRPRPAGMSPPL